MNMGTALVTSFGQSGRWTFSHFTMPPDPFDPTGKLDHSVQEDGPDHCTNGDDQEDQTNKDLVHLTPPPRTTW